MDSLISWAISPALPLEIIRDWIVALFVIFSYNLGFTLFEYYKSIKKACFLLVLIIAFISVYPFIATPLECMDGFGVDQECLERQREERAMWQDEQTRNEQTEYAIVLFLELIIPGFAGVYISRRK